MATTYFVWDELSDNVILETNENDVVTTEYVNEPRQFGELISQNRDSVDSFYSYDGDYSTRILTNQAGNATDTSIYSAYGEEISATGTSMNPFGYKGAVGYYANPETNDIYVRARTYVPTTGRWLSTDPLGFIDGPNLYQAYFVPNGIDPSGKYKCRCTCRTAMAYSGFHGRESVREFDVTDVSLKAAKKECDDGCKTTYTASGGRICNGEVIDDRLPEYDPNQSGPVDAGTELEYSFASIDGPEGFCGFLSPQKMADCKETIKWHETYRGVSCRLQKATFKSYGSACEFIQSQIDSVKGTKKGYTFGCRTGHDCCNKKKYSGAYPVKVSGKRIPVGPGCAVSANVSATITFTGEIGACN